jgi:hypothetical protein
MVHEGLVQEGVVHEIGGPLEEVSSPIPHKILTMMHLIHSGRISGQRRSVSFPVQDGIRSSSSSGSSNYPTGQDPVYNPLHGNDNRVREPMDPSIMYVYGKYEPPPPPYSNLSNMYPLGPQYGYGQVPAAPICSFALWISIYLSFLCSR